MRKKLILSILLGFVILLGISFQETSEAAYLEETEVNIYAVDQNLLEEFPELQIPSNYRQEYQVSVKDTTILPSDMGFYAKDEDGTIYIPSGVEIDREKGIIKPKLMTVVDQNGEELYKRYDYVTKTIYIRVGEEELKLTVNIVDYSKIYVENQLKQYINTNFAGMSDYDKALAITKYVANQYDYSGNYQSFRDMYLYKCGDCWASTNLINKICELAGIPSHTRNGNQDAGAGSGHTNNAILIDGKVYIADAGYSGTKETRQYDFYLEDPAYTCKVNSDNTVTLLQYDGFETETLVIPSVIRGRTVTVIGSSFYSSNTIRPKSIVLPNTIQTIESLAFYPGSSYADNLESIVIPQSVTSIEYAAFSECKKLNITIAKNGNFVVENDVLYNKDKTVLIQVLPKYAKDTTLTIPSTVKEIKKSAFFAVKGIKKVILPSTIETIANQSFYGAEIEGIKIPKSVKKIEYGAFAQNDKLISVEIEEGCTAEIEELAFASCYKLTSIKIPSTVTIFGADVFYRNWGDLVIYAPENSKAHDYAKENNIKFSSGKISLIEKNISIEEKMVYQPGKNRKPNITVEYLGEALVEGKDYTTTYEEECYKPGKHQVILKGIGNFTGEITKQYEIEKAESRFTFSCEDITEGEILNPQINNPDNQTYTCYIYNSSGRQVQKPGIPGEYTYRYYVASNDYFKSKTITQKVSIKPASIPLESISREGFYSDMLYVGDTKKLEIIYTPANTTIKKNVEWRTDNEEVVKVDKEGNIVAVGEGDTYIYATVAGRTLSWKYMVWENTSPLESISIQGTTSNMKIGDTKALTVKMNPTDATCRSDIHWSSSNSEIVSIEKNGTITAKKLGTATITAKKQGKTATCQVTVIQPATSISLATTSLTMPNGSTRNLTATISPSNATNKTLEWSTSNSSIATVSNGVVTAKKGGTCTITARTTDGTNKTATCQVTVTQPVTNIKLNDTSITIPKDSNRTITATISPNDATNRTIEWSTSDSSIATVSNGVIEAKALGTCTITAKTTDGTNLVASCKVTVTLPFTDVKIGDWYYGAVEYVYRNNIVSGTSATTFSPNEKVTRGMLVTMLHKMEGIPYVAGASKFSDVKDTNAYYYVAIKWATQNNIVSGYENGTFGPNDLVTREQLAVILNKYCRYKNKYQAQRNILSQFKDANKISNFAYWEMQWATGAGVITGSNGNLNPQGTATRAEVVSMLYKYCLNIK